MSSKKQDLGKDQVNILMVDDHAENLLALEAILQKPGFHLISATSGSEALKYLLKYEFAVILLDVMMPGMDGYEVATFIKEREMSRYTPIIFLTAIAKDIEHIFKGYSVGAVDYILKPLAPEIVRTKVNVFVELYQKSQEIKQQAERLAESERREKEYELEELKRIELQKTIQARDEFFSIASHELKTPVTSLKLELQMLERQLKKKSQELIPALAIKERLDIAVKQTSRLEKLIENLLDVSRIQLNRLSIDREKVDFVALVKEVVNNMAQQIQISGSALSIEAEGVIEGFYDRLRMEQVIMNLLSNAIKYGDGKPIEIRVEADSQNIVFSIRDHGKGISKQDQERIFDRFERAILSRDISGIGLGLYISREIIKAHGGRIEVQSELGKGSLFTVVIPKMIHD